MRTKCLCNCILMHWHNINRHVLLDIHVSENLFKQKGNHMVTKKNFKDKWVVILSRFFKIIDSTYFTSLIYIARKKFIFVTINKIIIMYLVSEMVQPSQQNKTRSIKNEFLKLQKSIKSIKIIINAWSCYITPCDRDYHIT